MNILIFFEYANHYQTIDNLCKNLDKKGISVSSFNIAYWRFRNWNCKGMTLWIRILSFIAMIPRVRGVVTKLYQYRAMLKLTEKYDIIDIHFFSPIYDKLVEELNEKGKKIKITIWGDDFYRVDSIRHEQQRRIYHLVDIIQLETQQIAEHFLEVYPEFSAKVRIAHFGIIQFDIIDELLQIAKPEHYKEELGIPKDKIALTLGTNRSEGHQHIKMLESVESLPPEKRNQLFLIIPMTYGGRKSYIKTVRQKVETIGLPYVILISYLSLQDLSKYRIVSDITLTIQVSDALASAIQEHLYTGEILIAGDWLPYKILDDSGVFYPTTSLEKLSQTLQDTIGNYNDLKLNCAGNQDKLSKISSWKSAIIPWIDIYTEISN